MVSLNLNINWTVVWLLLGVLLVAALGSVVALVLAFFHRPSARWVAGVAVAAVLGLGSIVLADHGWELWRVPQMLVEGWPGSAVFVVPPLLAGLAAFLPLAKPPGDSTVPAHVRRNRWLVGLGVGIPMVVAAVVGVVQLASL